MNRDDVIRMAHEAGLSYVWNSEDWVVQQEELILFAQLVAAAEREACAKVCEAYDSADPLNVSGECAECIRLKGNQS
jgi:hypothetical protein